MKKKLIMILAAVLFVSCISIMPAMATKYATFDVLDTCITIGESFDVNVSVYDDGTLGDLTAFGFEVDPLSSLTLFSYDYATLDTNFDNGGTGGSYVGGLYNGTGNAGTDALLATLSFTADSTAGTDTLNIKGMFDGDFSGLFYVSGDEDIVGSIDIDVIPPGVPEPATMLLLGAGLVGLAGFRKKFKS